MPELLPGCAFPSVHIVGSLASKLPSIIPESLVKGFCFPGRGTGGGGVSACLFRFNFSNYVVALSHLSMWNVRHGHAV